MSGVNESNDTTSATSRVHPSGFISVFLLLKQIVGNLSYTDVENKLQTTRGGHINTVPFFRRRRKRSLC